VSEFPGVERGVIMPSQTIEIPVADGTTFTGYLSLPPSGQGPGIVLIQEIYGVNADMRAAADAWAEEGYTVLVPDLFWRFRPGIELGYDPEQFAEAFAYLQKFDIDQGVADIESAVAVLKRRPECKGGVGALGYCMGGRLAYLAAARLELDAVVSYYGVGIEKNLEEAAGIRCPLILIFGDKDQHIGPDARDRIERALAGKPNVTIAIYPGMAHGFANPGRNSYNRLSAQLAHSQSLGIIRAAIGPRFDLVGLWEKHCEYEFNSRDVDATMGTMVAQPYVNHIPTMTGGVGYKDLHRFYKNHFIARLPRDIRIVLVSRTVGADRVVDELLLCFTHDTEIDFLLPGVPPTGKYVEVPTVAVVTFRGDKIAHAHIHWDQATLLVQIGLLDPKGLPIAGIETARKLLDETFPSNTLMARWDESAPQG
jgi:carboxymethylenebutenolidase